MNEAPIRVVPRATAADGQGAGRRLKLKVLRHNPHQPGSVPHWQTYEIEEAEGMTLFIALSEIREKLDPSLQFDFVCRAGICGSCAMVIDGKPALACRTLTKNLGAEATLRSARAFYYEAIGDAFRKAQSGDPIGIASVGWPSPPEIVATFDTNGAAKHATPFPHGRYQFTRSYPALLAANETHRLAA